MKDILESIVPFPSLGREKSEAEQRLQEFLSNGSGEPFGLTYEKYSNRGEMRSAEGSPGKYIVSVERHRAVAGCSYRRGSPMAAFQTFRQELLFDPELMKLDDYDVQHTTYTINIGSLAQQLADYDWNPKVLRRRNWKSKRRVELSICNWSIETRSRETARDALEEELRALNHGVSFESLEMSAEERSDYSWRLEDAFTEIILGEFDRNWNSPELIE